MAANKWFNQLISSKNSNETWESFVWKSTRITIVVRVEFARRSTNAFLEHHQFIFCTIWKRTFAQHQRNTSLFLATVRCTDRFEYGQGILTKIFLISRWILHFQLVIQLNGIELKSILAQHRTSWSRWNSFH